MVKQILKQNEDVENRQVIIERNVVRADVMIAPFDFINQLI
jgi:hypothetical protein